METSHAIYNDLAVKHFHTSFIYAVTNLLTSACRNTCMERLSLDYDIFRSVCSLLVDFLPWETVENDIVYYMCTKKGIELISIYNEFLKNYSESEIVRDEICETLHTYMKHKQQHRPII